MRSLGRKEIKITRLDIKVIVLLTKLALILPVFMKQLNENEAFFDLLPDLEVIVK